MNLLSYSNKNGLTINDRAKLGNTTAYSFVRVFYTPEVTAVIIYTIIISIAVSLLFHTTVEY